MDVDQPLQLLTRVDVTDVPAQRPVQQHAGWPHDGGQQRPAATPGCLRILTGILPRESRTVQAEGKVQGERSLEKKSVVSCAHEDLDDPDGVCTHIQAVARTDALWDDLSCSRDGSCVSSLATCAI